MDKLPIEPFGGRACATFAVPGSKSITNRAMLLGAMSDYPIRLVNPLVSRDSVIMSDCLSKLGYDIKHDPKSIAISGACALKGDLFVGNAGTAARFLTAFVCTQVGGEYSFDSDEAMYKRPMAGLIKALKQQGAVFSFKKDENCFPFTVKTSGLSGGEIELDASESSQILSAILMACPMAFKDSIVRLKGDTVSKPFVDMTVKMMDKFGFCVEKLTEGSYKILHGLTTSPSKYEIEADATAASYPIALAAAVGGAVLIENFPFSDMQGDVRFANLMQEAGFVKTSRVGNDLLVTKAGEPEAEIDLDFNDISDTFLTLAAIAPVIGANVRIKGIAHTRKQESDRVAAAANGVEPYAKSVKFGNDFIEVKALKFSEIKNKISAPVEIETYEDHRIAMSFGIAGCADVLGSGKPWMDVLDPDCVSKTFPEFFGALQKARKASEVFKIVAIDGGAAVGKSSVSKECARILNYMHVDTGAHYRTLSFILLQNDIASDSEDEAKEFLRSLKISIYLEGNSARMSVDGKRIKDADIRTDTVNQNVSIFAAMPSVRSFLKSYQRSMADEAAKHRFAGLVMEGRDIGSVIFPNADLKIFLDADETTRRLRRQKEGISDSIEKRDTLDKARKTAPLVCEKDAKRIDTSHMTKDEVVAKAISLIIKA